MKTNFIKYLFAGLMIILLSNCDRLDKLDFKKLLFSDREIDVETRFKESMEFNREDGEIIINVPSGNYRFYEAADVHIQKTTNNLEMFLDTARNDATAAFISIVGDLIDEYGAFDVFAPALDFDSTTQKYDIPLFTTMGNHDTFFKQWYDYSAYFGSSVYTFTVNFPQGKDLYIMLDSANGTIGKSQLKWLKDLLKSRKNYRHCIVFSHTNLFKMVMQQGTGNVPLEETCELISLFTDNKVTAYISGHVHTYGVDVFNGVMYVTGVTMKDSEKNAGYLLCEVTTNRLLIRREYCGK